MSKFPVAQVVFVVFVLVQRTSIIELSYYPVRGQNKNKIKYEMVGGWVGGSWWIEAAYPSETHMHTHTHTHIQHRLDNFVWSLQPRALVCAHVCVLKSQLAWPWPCPLSGWVTVVVTVVPSF